jgi:hypothetical protein
MRMNERIARALCLVAPKIAISGAIIGWSDLSEESRSDYRIAAQRVIAEMRYPTDEMLADGDRRGLPRDAANVWERMIFRALHEGPE